MLCLINGIQEQENGSTYIKKLIPAYRVCERERCQTYVILAAEVYRPHTQRNRYVVNVHGLF